MRLFFHTYIFHIPYYHKHLGLDNTEMFGSIELMTQKAEIRLAAQKALGALAKTPPDIEKVRERLHFIVRSTEIHPRPMKPNDHFRGT